MTILDVVLVLVGAAAGVAGWTMGLVSRLFSWLGLAVGLILVSLALPGLLDRLDDIDEKWLLLIAILLVVAGAMAGQAVGMVAGRRLRLRIHPRWHDVDAIGGSVMGVLGVVVVVWLLAPAVRTVPGWSADQVDDSAVVAVIDAVSPPPPDTFRTLRRIVGADQFPQVFSDATPGVEVGEPPEAVPVGAEVLRGVVGGVVRIRAVACSQRQDGTGFFVAPGQVVTNAHVVAGSLNIEVTVASGEEVGARVLGFDSDRDLALLGVDAREDGLLGLADAEGGDRGAVVGHPRGGELRVAPVEIAERVRAKGRDLYDEHETDRQVFFLAASLEPGDSGAPLVDLAGDVVGVIFAIAPDDPDVAFALTSLEVRDFLADVDPASEVSSDDCL